MVERGNGHIDPRPRQIWCQCECDRSGVETDAQLEAGALEVDQYEEVAGWLRPSHH